MSKRTYTAEAASNIAFIKYWGAVDLERTLPANPSVSMTLDSCRSICCASYEPGRERADEVWWIDEGGAEAPAPPGFSTRVLAHLDRLRRHFECTGALTIRTRNTFPAAAGIASSASGFTALTLAVAAALGHPVTGAELSELARRSGSGSASRSAFGGYVLWPADAESTHAVQLFSPEHWQLSDVIAIVQSSPKDVSSLDGHRRATTSPYFEERQRRLPAKLRRIRAALAARDFETLGQTIEEEAIDLHLIAMSSTPPIFYWQPATLSVLEEVRRLRQDGIGAYATMDAGANVHVICESPDENRVASRLESLEGVVRIIRDRVGGPPSVTPGAHL